MIEREIVIKEERGRGGAYFAYNNVPLFSCFIDIPMHILTSVHYDHQNSHIDACISEYRVLKKQVVVT